MLHFFSGSSPGSSNNYEPFILRAKNHTTHTLDLSERIKLAKETSTITETLLRFFKSFLIILQQGWRQAIEEHERHFERKSEQILRSINTTCLKTATSGLIEEEGINAYLSNLEDGRVLSTEFDLAAIRTFESCYQIAKEAKKERTHWLNQFKNKEDLGENFEHLYSLPVSAQEKIIQINDLQKKERVPGLASFIQQSLCNEKLKTLSNVHLEEIKTFFTFSQTFTRKGIEGFLDTQKSVILLKRIEKEKQEEFKTFFLNSPSDVQNLFLRFSDAPLEDLLKAKELIQTLINAHLSLPIDLYLSQNLDKMIEKLEDELPENSTITRIKRFGEPFSVFYSNLNLNALPPSLKESLKELDKIEANFRLCGEGEQFKEIVHHYFETSLIHIKGLTYGKGFDSVENFQAAFKKMQTQDAKNEPFFSLIKNADQSARQIQTYIKSEVNVDEDFQQFLLSTKTLLKPSKSFFTTSNFHDKFQAAVIAFNQRQYEQFQETWSDYAGKEHFNKKSQEIAKDYPQIQEGLTHYKENRSFLKRQVELEKMIFYFNLAPLAEEYGESFLSYTIDSLFYEIQEREKESANEADGQKKEQIRSLSRLQKNWNVCLESLNKLKAQLINEGIDSSLFKQSWETYLSSLNFKNEPNKLMTRTNELALNSDTISDFKKSLELKKTEEKLQALEITHGPLFVSSLKQYLKAKEPDIANGKKPFSQADFFKIPQGTTQDDPALFRNQLATLKPYLLQTIQQSNSSTQLIDLLSTSSSPENFKLRSSQWAELEKLIKKKFESKWLSKEVDKALAKECLFLFISSSNLLDKEASSFNKAAEDTLQKMEHLVKFCQKTPARQQLYSANLLAKAAFHLFTHNLLNDASLNKLCLENHIREKSAKYVRDSNKQNDAIRIERLIERVLASFNHKDQLPQFPHGIDSLTNLIYLIVDLSAYTSDERIMKTILSNYHIPFDVKKINGFKEPLNFNPIKEKITEEIKNLIKTKNNESEFLINLVRDKPFTFLHSFLPLFLAKLSSKVDPSIENTICKELYSILIPLEADFNNSSFVETGKELFSYLLKLILSNKEEIGTTKDSIGSNLIAFTHLDIEKVAKENPHLSIQTTLGLQLTKNGLDLLWNIAIKLLFSVFYAHNKKLIETTGTPQTDTTTTKDPVVTFFYETIPFLVKSFEGKDELIKKIESWIPTLKEGGMKSEILLNTIIGPFVRNFLLPFVIPDNKLRTFLADQILTNQIIKALIFLIPTLKENHEFELYSAYVIQLNDMLKSTTPLKEENFNHLAILTLKLFQQLVRDIAKYHLFLESALKEAHTQMTFKKAD